jgi:UPF0755 protein
MNAKSTWPARGNKKRRGSAGWGPDRGPDWKRWVARVVVVAGFVAFVVVGYSLVGKGVHWYRDHSTTTTEVAQVKTHTVTVEAGMSAAEIGDALETQGVIQSAAEFVDLVKSRGTANALLPGTYTFEGELALIDVVDMLETGEGSQTFKLTIKEGLSVSQVGSFLTEDGHISGADYVKMSTDPTAFELPEIGGSVPTDLTTLEGLLFPSTYWLTQGDSATDLIGAQLKAFTDKTSSLPWENADDLGVTPYEIVTIASMIDKEVSVPEERALVAAVIYNRLKKKMTLGIDATVRYALDKWTGDLTTEDLAVDSPYNTRLVKGLPPTPIASPSLAALEAALEPADVDYLYYVLQDTEGHHFFTASKDEFDAASQNQPEQ